MNFIFLAIFAVASVLGEIDVTNYSSSGNLKRETRAVIHEVNLNEVFDESLPIIRSTITKNGLDPMDIPDVEVPLGPLPGLMKTKMLLHHGHMQELSTIFRAGDVILQYDETKISLYLNLGFETLDMSHEYSLRYMLYNRKGDCYGRYHDVIARMLIDVDVSSRKIDLRFFKILSIGDFKLRVEGHLTDGVINIVTEALTKLFRNQVLLIIEQKTYDEVNKQIQKINDNPSGEFQTILEEIIKNIVGKNGTSEILKELSYM